MNRPEVQNAAVDLIVGSGDRNDDALVRMVREHGDQLAVSIQPRVHEWLGSSKSVEKSVLASSVATEGEFERLLARASAIKPRFRELAGIDTAVEAIAQAASTYPRSLLTERSFPAWILCQSSLPSSTSTS